MTESFYPFKPQLLFISSVTESTFSISLQEAHLLYANNPDIKACIVNDQDAYAKQKKVTRLLDQAWQREQKNKENEQFTFPYVKPVPSESKSESKDVTLDDGCPRMPAFMVFVCIYIRGQLGGIKSKHTQCFLQESRTFENICLNLGIKKPGASTIIDNLNVISTTTLNLIHKAQIRNAKNESLDTFDEATFDSTAVKGNVSWPTESNLLYLLVKRIYHIGSQLDQFESVRMQERNFPKIIKDLNTLKTKIWQTELH